MQTINLIRGTRAEIQIFENDSMVFDFAFVEDDGVTPVPISGWTFLMDFQAKGIQNCSTVGKFLSKTLGNGLEISYVNTLTGNFIMSLHPGTYNYNLVGTDETGAVTTWLYGSLKVVDKV